MRARFHKARVELARKTYGETLDRLFATAQQWARSKPGTKKLVFNFPGGSDVVFTGPIASMPREWCKSPDALELLEFCAAEVPDATILMFEAFCEQAQRKAGAS